MPPFREGPIIIDQRIDEDLIYVLRKAGHGVRLNIVDRSYDVPPDAEKLKFPGSSADALLGIVRLIPVEDNSVTIMLPDTDHAPETHPTSFMAGVAFEDVVAQLRAQNNPVELEELAGVYRKDDVPGGSDPGFYNLAKNPDERHIFVHTIDDLPFACVSLVVGHSQLTEVALENREAKEDAPKYAVFMDMQRFAGAHQKYSTQALGRLWSRIMIETGVGKEGVPGEDQGKITIGDEVLEIIRIGEDYSPEWRPVMSEQTAGLNMNLTTLEKMISTGRLREIRFIGSKAETFVREFLAAQGQT